MHGKIQTRNGFTLVELSIVLVILGLLVGGVLSGQSLIRAAELRSVTAQAQRYVTATNAFRDKYFALPGDMTNAQSFWGVADPTPATCITTASTDTKTCNGNGDGGIAMSAGSNEIFRFWQHLANAGLIEGNFSGTRASSAYDYSTSSANAPSGRIATSLWYVTWYGNLTGSTFLFDGSYGNSMFVGGLINNNVPANSIFKAEEAYNIDMKMDDGRPATGNIVPRQLTAWTGSSCSDATASSQLNANYVLSNSTPACAIYFRNAF